MNKLDDTYFGGEVKKFFDLPIFNRVRREDPITSYQAADSIKEVAPKHFKIILEALKEHGPMGKDGIASKTGLNPNAVARRLPELQKLDLVTTTGKTVKSLSGREEREWKSL
jgi:transcription initiation factor IIE alpha subunit